MAKERPMSTSARFEYFAVKQKQYREANCKGKSRILDEMESTTHLSRKHLIMRMNESGLSRKGRERERSCEYGPDVVWSARFIAETLDWICAERLTPALPDMLRGLAKYGEMVATPELEAQLAKISVSTVRRLLSGAPHSNPGLPKQRRGRRPDTVTQSMVPISVIPWQIPVPGYFEVDLVIHGIPDENGQPISTIQFIDICTGWSERFAIRGHEFHDLWPVFLRFRTHCPIPVREIHIDNGSEFLNHALISHLGEEMVHVRVTRGRPGCKNDNRFVEQKNSSLIRYYLGHLPLHTTEHCQRLDAFYQDMWLYYNFFQPVLRQTSRTATTGSDGLCRIVRQQDQAATPLQRLLSAKPPLSRAKADQLLALRAETNPRALWRRIHQQLTELARLSSVYESRRSL